MSPQLYARDSVASSEHVRRGLIASGSEMAAISMRTEQTAECLLEGDLERSSRIFGGVMADLMAFFRLLAYAKACLDDKRLVLDLYQEQLVERLELIERLGHERDLTSLAELLKYEMVPLFAGWDGMCGMLLRSMSETAPAADGQRSG